MSHVNGDINEALLLDRQRSIANEQGAGIGLRRAPPADGHGAGHLMIAALSTLAAVSGIGLAAFLYLGDANAAMASSATKARILMCMALPAGFPCDDVSLIL